MREVSCEAMPQFTLQVFLLIMLLSGWIKDYDKECGWIDYSLDAIDVISLVLSFLSINYSIGLFFLDAHLGEKVTLKHSLRLLAVEFASVLAQPYLFFTFLYIFYTYYEDSMDVKLYGTVIFIVFALHIIVYSMLGNPATQRPSL